MIPLSRIHSSLTAYFSASVFDSSVVLIRVGADFNTGAHLFFRRKLMKAAYHRFPKRRFSVTSLCENPVVLTDAEIQIGLRMDKSNVWSLATVGMLELEIRVALRSPKGLAARNMNRHMCRRLHERFRIVNCHSISHGALIVAQ